MKVIEVSESSSKLCHARPGDVVRFCEPPAGYSATYVVCFLPEVRDLSHTKFGPEGLHMCVPAVRLLDVETGALHGLPHASSRCDIYRKAQLHLYAPPAQPGP